VDPEAVLSFAWDDTLYATLPHPSYPAKSALRPPPFGARWGRRPYADWLERTVLRVGRRLETLALQIRWWPTQVHDG